MKVTSSFISTILFLIMVVSCRSHEEKGDGAFKDFKDEKLINLNVKNNSIDSSSSVSNLRAYQKLTKLNDALQFKTNLETFVKSNNTLILNLKNKYKLNAARQSEIMQLELINNQFIVHFQSYEVNESKRRLIFEKKIMKEVANMNLTIKRFTTLK